MNNEQEKKMLIRRLHALRSVHGMSQSQYDALLDGFGVESSREMTCGQLQDACRMIVEAYGGGDPKEAVRRRLIATACRMLAGIVKGWGEMGDGERVEYAKTVACRAAGLGRWDDHGRDNYNRLTAERMRSLCYAFNKRAKDMDRAVEVALEVMSGKEAER